MGCAVSCAYSARQLELSMAQPFIIDFEPLILTQIFRMVETIKNLLHSGENVGFQIISGPSKPVWADSENWLGKQV